VQAKAATPLSTAAAASTAFCMRIVPVVLFLFSVSGGFAAGPARPSCQIMPVLSKDRSRDVPFVTDRELSDKSVA
jgi:hypothetical protein